MLSEHKDLKLSNTALQISEWNPTFPDGDGRSYGSPNLPPCASSPPRSLAPPPPPPRLSLGWYFLDICSWQAQQLEPALHPLPGGRARDVGTEVGGEEGWKEGEWKTREWSGEEGAGRRS